MDRYPCYGEIKGGTVPLNYVRFIVTSNYLPEELWPGDAVLALAIRRRCVFTEFVFVRRTAERGTERLAHQLVDVEHSSPKPMDGLIPEIDDDLPEKPEVPDDF